jgi:diguanylate cyclase (GGDEF)-like protein/PAS domain S-box-containing protein
MGALVLLDGWPPADQTLAFWGLLVAVILIGAHSGRSSLVASRTTMRPSFVFVLTTLILLGTPAAMVIAVAGEFAEGFTQAAHPRRGVRILTSTAEALVAIQFAGAVHLMLGGTIGHFTWPFQAAPIAAAVVAYCIGRGTTAVVVPLLARQPIDPAWASQLLRSCAPHAVGAAMAVALAEAIAHGQWLLLPVAAVPLYLAYRAYDAFLDHHHEEHRRREVTDALVQGMTVLDSDGQVTLWSDEMTRLVGCPPDRALGQSLVSAVPALDRTELPRLVHEVLSLRSPRTLARLILQPAASPRILEVRVLPVEGGATLIWHDLTDRIREDGVVRRSEARLALAAEAANDGLWEWDLRQQECFFSGRWREMVGLAAQAGPGRPEDWLGRVHPDDAGSLKEALDAHLGGVTDRLYHEQRLRHEDGSYRLFVCRGIAERGSTRRTGRLAGSLTAQTEHATARERIRGAGYADPLTGLANRTVFAEQLGRRLAESKSQPGGGLFAVLYLDLDRFKVVNDSLGHLVGDQLLTAVSRRLESCLRPSDLLARLGGDEFAILLNSLGHEQQANAVAFRIQESLSAPFQIGAREVYTTASIGIAIGLPQYASPDEIMRDADTAMYHAKTRGKARHELFDADMHARVRDRLGLENDLRHAVANNEFEVHYQPIVLLASGMCVGFESLIRWKRHGEPVPPDQFIPLAEEVGLIEPIGTWVLRQACRTFADWRRRFPDGLDYITVNVSSRQLVQHNFLGIVERAVHDAGLKPCDLRLEITETALMENPKVAAGMLRELRDFGVKIYLDDFGTGYSSLSHLHKLPVDALKIDRSFVNSLLRSDRPIVESILALARTLNTSVVAEGIESDAQAMELERLGCTHAQGYLFSRPLTMQAVEAMLLLNQPLGPKRFPAAEAEVAGHDHYADAGPFEWPKSVSLGSAAPIAYASARD